MKAIEKERKNVKYNPELTIAIPAYNEETKILNCLQQVDLWLRANLKGVKYEILVIDDGSVDKTSELLADIQKSVETIRVVHHRQNFGRGRAIRTAFSNSQSDILVCLDADLSYSPDHIASLYYPIKNDQADVTLASVYLPGGSMSGVPFGRAFISRVGNKILSWGFGNRFRTVTCVVRGFRRSVIDDLELINTGKDLHLEILQKCIMLGHRIKEVPGHLKWSREKSERRLDKKNKNVFLSMRGVIISHLLFNYNLRPLSIIAIPMIIQLIGLIIGVWMLAAVFFKHLFAESNSSMTSHILNSARQTLIDGQLTLIITIIFFFSSLFVLLFLFLAYQAKKYFEEQYLLLSRINARIKKLETRK